MSEVEKYQNVYRLKSPEWHIVKEKKSPEDHDNFNYYVAFLYDDVPLRVEISPFLASYFLTPNIFYDKFIEFIVYNGRFILIRLQGVVDYRSLYETEFLHCDEETNNSIHFLSQRVLTKQEKKYWLSSKWTHFLGFTLLYSSAISIMFYMYTDPTIFTIIVPFLLVLFFFTYKTSRATQRNLDLRFILVMRGDIRFDEHNDLFYFGDKQALKLPPKWHQYLKTLMAKENRQQIKDAQVEAIVLSHDYLDDKQLHVAYQALSIQSEFANLNNAHVMLQTAPSHRWPRAFLIAFSSIVLIGLFSNIHTDFYYSMQNSMQNNLFMVDDIHMKTNHRQFIHVKGMAIPVVFSYRSGRKTYRYDMEKDNIFLMKVDSIADYQQQFEEENTELIAQIEHVEKINKVYQKLHKSLNADRLNYSSELIMSSLGGRKASTLPAIAMKQAMALMPKERDDLLFVDAYADLVVAYEHSILGYLRFRKRFLAFQVAFGNYLTDASNQRLHALTQLDYSQALKVPDFEYIPSISSHHTPQQRFLFLSSYPKMTTVSGILYRKQWPFVLIDEKYTQSNYFYLRIVVLLWVLSLIGGLISLWMTVSRIKRNSI